VLAWAYLALAHQPIQTMQLTAAALVAAAMTVGILIVATVVAVRCVRSTGW
jgi:hypothetical protein